MRWASLLCRAVYQSVGSLSRQSPACPWPKTTITGFETLRRFEIAQLQKTLYEYRWHGQSLTNTAPGNAVWVGVEKTLPQTCRT